ncbi:MAG: BatD family protein [Gammaproteobacteria bacterium]|jgi:hypothetical protein|nr:BatD family protein [Gammaproteobacteria bacterium]
MGRRWIAMLLLLASLAPWAAQASVSASLDRSTIAMDESVTLRLVIRDEDDNAGAPDFSPLARDFEILSRSQSSSFNLINGTASRSLTWQLTLMPRAAGVFTIPPLRVGATTSKALQLTVRDTPTEPDHGNADIFLEVEVDQTTPRVQAQVLYTVRLFHAVNFNSGASLTEPRSEGAEMVVQKLGDDASYEKIVNGRRYAVVERRYALFPQASGELEISPLLFEARIARRRDFFPDPLGYSGQLRRVHSQAIHLSVQPIPPDFHAPHWLPARSLELSESWPTEPPHFTVGEPLTRKVRLRARGLAAAQLPELEQKIPAQLRQYPDQAESNETAGADGLESERTEKVALIATRPGHYRLPELRLKWWNTRSDQAEEAVLPARDIEVAPAAGAPTRPPAVVQPAPLSAASEPSPPRTGRDWWPPLAGLLGLGWLLTLLVWWWRSRGRPENSEPRREPRGGGLRQLRTACRNGDAPACRTALLAWARHQWPGDPPQNLGALAARLGAAGEPVRGLEACLYNPAADAGFDSAGLLRAIADYRPQTPATGPASELDPLYRIR